MYFDWTYLIIVMPMLIISMVAQAKVNSTYSKYAKVLSSRGYTAEQVARRMLDESGLHAVQIAVIPGELTDHYDPRTDTVSLSQSVYGKSSVAAIGVAAHEVGHAMQHAEGYFPIKVRNAIIPITQIGSRLAVPLVIIGIIFEMASLAYAGIILFGTVALFQLVTLPTEFNASRRAIATLSQGILTEDELLGAKKVLSAAAMTYLAALFVALASLLRLIIIVSGSGRRRR